MTIVSGRTLRAALVLGAGLSLAGCDSFRDELGVSKQAPDEFAVVTKAPLIIPPDYNLRPPKPGAAPENQVEPSQAAQQSLFGADAATVAKSMEGNMSPGEKLLLANAGAQNADPAIRQTLATDRNKALQASSDDFTNSVLFWQKPSVPDDPAVNADAEAKKVSSQTDGKTATPDKASGDDAAKPATDDQTSVDKEKKSGGWFDWF
jgi:hypothetical protein